MYNPDTVKNTKMIWQLKKLMATIWMSILSENSLLLQTKVKGNPDLITKFSFDRWSIIVLKKNWEHKQLVHFSMYLSKQFFKKTLTMASTRCQLQAVREFWCVPWNLNDVRGLGPKYSIKTHWLHASCGYIVFRLLVRPPPLMEQLL